MTKTVTRHELQARLDANPGPGAAGGPAGEVLQRLAPAGREAFPARPGAPARPRRRARQVGGNRRVLREQHLPELAHRRGRAAADRLRRRRGVCRRQGGLEGRSRGLNRRGDGRRVEPALDARQPGAVGMRGAREAEVAAPGRASPRCRGARRPGCARCRCARRSATGWPNSSRPMPWRCQASATASANSAAPAPSSAGA